MRLMVQVVILWCSLMALLGLGGSEVKETSSKTASTFFPAPLRQQLQQTIARYDWAKQTAQRVVQAAEFWRRMSDEELWGLMFGPTITRSWHVWSNGYCPACRKPVPMYNWRIDAVRQPWKVQCPHCGELFPKNDFAAFLPLRA